MTYRKEQETIKYKRSFFIGCLLGDAYSRRVPSARGRLKAAYTFCHGLKQQDFVEWKAQQFNEMYGLKPNVRVEPKWNRVTFDITVRRRLRVIHDWFHKNGVKTITPKIRFMDHPVGLAMLLCDDGSIRKRKQVRKDGSVHYLPPSITIATHCFAPDQVHLLLKHIQNVCAAKGYINPERRWRNGKRVEYARVNFNAEESLKLWNYVKDYIPRIPSMMQKFAFIIERYGID